MKVWTHLVQYYETDQMGIVHHSNYIRWFEEARVELLRQTDLSCGKLEEMGIIIPVLGVSAKYHTMTHFEDEVQIALKLTKFDGIRLELSYEITDRNTGALRCSGTSSHCFLNREGRPISLKRSYPEIYSKIKTLLISE
jgi:acyl-CoA thioester hydrolase